MIVRRPLVRLTKADYLVGTSVFIMATFQPKDYHGDLNFSYGIWLLYVKVFADSLTVTYCIHSRFWFGALWIPSLGVSGAASCERCLCFVDFYSCIIFFLLRLITHG
jgi:hypothetical protein